MKYYPYLRGKQYELLALREISEVDTSGNVICPIIEPIKLSPTLKKTIEILRDGHRPFVLVVNPEYGELSGKSVEQTFSEIMAFIGESVPEMSIALLYHVRTAELQDFLQNQDVQNVSLIVKKDPSETSVLSNLLVRQGVNKVFVDESLSRSVRRLIRNSAAEKITLANRFEVKAKNADYQEQEDEFFSDDHLYFEEDGFQGFSDYSTIGDEYKDSGFLPYAVAIHLTYMKEDNVLWIHHFVSDSNDDYNDVPNKLYEALTKMHHWYQEKEYPHTRALNQLMDYYDKEAFPGLGMLKKLSMLNHFEIISNYFNNELQ